MKKKENFNLKIYEKNLNNKYNLIPQNTKMNDTGKIKYLPPYFSEWNSTIYSFSKDFIKNMPLYNNLVNKLIKNYFNLLFLSNRYVIPKKRRLFLKDIYISNSKIKLTNSIAIITLYTVNLRKYLFTKYFNYFYYYSIKKEWEKSWDKDKQNWIWVKTNSISLTKIMKNKLLRFMNIEIFNSNLNNKFIINNYIYNNIKLDNIKTLLSYKFKLFNNYLISYNLYRKIYLTKEIKHIYYQYLTILYKYSHKYFIHNFKYENKNISFIAKLKSNLSKIYGKKIKLNLVNLKSIAFNSDIFTKSLSTKLKKRKFNLIKSMATIVNKGKFITKYQLEDKKLSSNKNKNLLENKYKNLSLVHNTNKNNLDFLLESIYSSNSKKRIRNIIFDQIKYKNIGGMRLEIKGRLTKRYRADRAIYKLHWKGGLKNIDSSFKGLSSTVFRGYLNSNILYSINKSKRRIGSFAVKGWIGGR